MIESQLIMNDQYFYSRKTKIKTEKQNRKQKVILFILTHLQLSLSNIQQERQCRNHRLNVHFFHRVFDNSLSSVLVRGLDESE